MEYIDFYFQDRKKTLMDERNRILLDNPQTIELILLGDSITEMFNLTHFGVLNKSVLNSGIYGDEIKHMRNRLERDVLQFKPKKVLLMAGINDIMKDGFTVNNQQQLLEKIFNEYIKIIEDIREKEIEVICCSIIKISNPEMNWMFINHIISVFNEMIKKYCNNNKMTYIDYNEVMENAYQMLDNSYTDDFLHPNNYGYMEMFKVLKKNDII